MSARPLPDGFAPYEWAPPVEAIAARHGLHPAAIIRFDQNVPPLPGVPQVPLGQSFARLNDYPDGTYRELREAAAAYTGVDPDQIVPGAGADGLIALAARTFLRPGSRAFVEQPAYPVYAVATGIEGAQLTGDPSDADLIWVCNPNNPTGALVEPEEIAALARSLPDVAVVVDEAYFEYGGKTAAPLVADTPNLVVLRTLSKAFGLAALRVGYAVASAEVARELNRRRDPAPVSAPSARIGAAALREPRLDVEETIAERERMRTALLAAGYDCPPSAGNFVVVHGSDRADELEAQGLVTRRRADGFRITVRLPAENDRILAALGAVPAPATARSSLVVRTTAETALRVSLDLDGRGRARVATGVGFLDHLLTLFSYHGGIDLDLLAGGDLEVDEHHTVEDVLAALGDGVTEALDRRDGVTRYGAATVPMDEARATVAVDLVRRPHAEVSLSFRGERVGGLALTLLPHALERFAAQAGLTLHVEASGKDDHHVAEAAFKALGRALREACALDAGATGSTKGSL